MLWDVLQTRNRMFTCNKKEHVESALQGKLHLEDISQVMNDVLRVFYREEMAS